MTVTEQIAKFRPELQAAFLKMIMGRVVELSNQGKERYEIHTFDREKKEPQKPCQWFTITAINEDETINLRGENQVELKNWKLKDLAL